MMAYRLLIIAGLTALSTLHAQTSRAPVLVELFTSEGCSSCPPADRLLEEIDSRAVVLSEHVDYWNHDGWADPFSSAELTARQEAYSRRFRTEGPYTPQMVVDGAAQFVGSDAARARSELASAAQRSATPIGLARTANGVRVDIANATATAGVFLVLADDSGDSNVSAGENRGRRLHHVAIARSLRKIGKVERGGKFEKEIAMAEKARGQRVIVFLQEGDSGPVSGAAVLLPGK
jgi:hypothetical protein